jgi:hypothetical protein
MTGPARADVNEEVQAKLEAWQALNGTFAFEQKKQLAGFSRPLLSHGELIIQSESLHWNTERPVASSLKVDASGVHQLGDDGGERIEGSAFVGQLLLAMLHQNFAFIDKHFTPALRDECVELTPREASMREYYQQIALCGDEQLERIEMRESSGSETQITLQQVIDA